MHAAIYYPKCSDNVECYSKCSAFVPPQQTVLPNEISLTDSWKIQGGIYIFLGEPAQVESKLLRQLYEYTAIPGNEDIGLLWIGNPNASVRDWQTIPLHFETLKNGTRSLTHSTTIAMRNYGIELPEGCTINLGSSSEAQFEITGNFTLIVTTGREKRLLPIMHDIIRVDINNRGRLGCNLSLRTGVHDAEALDICCRFYYSDGEIQSLCYPIFDTSSRGFELYAMFDLFSPLDSLRTWLEFKITDQLPSFYRTIEGHPLTLQPQNGARLVFQKRPDELLAETQKELLTLVPDGTFAILPQGQLKIRCGLSGTEYLMPDMAGNSFLTFVPDKPAFAPLSTDTSGKYLNPLDDRARTSWIFLSAKTTEMQADIQYSYWAQPEGACLYGKAEEMMPNILAFIPMCVCKLSPAITAFYPLPPYSGINSVDTKNYLEMETSALCGARREVLYSSSPAESNTDLRLTTTETIAITPQGFKATIRDSLWSRLEIANCGGRQLAFTNIEGSLRAALLTGQQFIVISDPNAIRESFKEHTVNLEDWVMDLDPGRWHEHGTIMIIKNCPRSLEELVNELGAWALPGQFNRSPAETQKKLQKIIKESSDSISERSTPLSGIFESDSKYADFLDIIKKDSWQGILCLNVSVEAKDGTSDKLRAILAAADQAKFKAHHLGVEITPVSGDPPVMGESAFFGLIHYYDEFLTINNAQNHHQVLEISALFKNSLVKSFSSRIALTLNEIFGATTKKRDDRYSNTLFLHGSLQHGKDDMSNAYIFVQEKPVIFELTESALVAVEIDRAELNASIVEDSKDKREIVENTFTLWGSLRFAKLQGYNPDEKLIDMDLLSFDSLVFAGLIMVMRFPFDARMAQSFTLDTKGVSFDLNTSISRSESFAARFPVTARGMISSSQAKSPAELGFMTVNTRLATRSLSSPWYGLVFDLSLGSAGALAAKIGFVATLVFAWAPEKNGTPFSVGLKLPGSSGAANTIGIQGVLALNIYSIDLDYDDGFALTLNGVKLTFLKKKLPPAGSLNFYLFGGKNVSSVTAELGWYGAYCKDKNPEIQPPAANSMRTDTAAAWSRSLSQGISKKSDQS